MDKKNDLSERLLRENGISSEDSADHVIKDIHQMIHKQRTRLRQMVWITCGLWLGTLIAWALKLPFGMQKIVGSETSFNAFKLYLSVFTEFLPMAAFVSTILLLIRRWSYSTKEVNLRLQLLEARLLKQEKESDGSQ